MIANEEISAAEAGQFIEWAKGVLGGEISAQKEAHGDEGVVYQVNAGSGAYFLKIKKGLTKERERLGWLINKLPVPRVVSFTELGGIAAMLLTAIPGRNLASLSKEWAPEMVIKKLAHALRRFHATDAADWPFSEPDPQKILVHGDACLPNFIFNGESFSGYIDLGAARLGDVEVDLAATVWSLDYNMGPGHGSAFLKEYGYRDTSEAAVEKLRLQYESWQNEQGFL